MKTCAARIREAQARGSGVILIYGAHLLRNGTAPILDRMMEHGWITHLATNGAGTIHDWEYAWLGRSTESVRANVATGTFGSWDETGRNIHLALLAGGLRGRGLRHGPGPVHRRGRHDSARSAEGSSRRSAAEPSHPLDARPGRRPAGHRDPRLADRTDRRSRTAGSTRRSWPRPSGMACR